MHFCRKYFAEEEEDIMIESWDEWAQMKKLRLFQEQRTFATQADKMVKYMYYIFLIEQSLIQKLLSEI